MTPREELMQYLSDYPISQRALRPRPVPRDYVHPHEDKTTEGWAFFAGSMVGILAHTIFVWLVS